MPNWCDCDLIVSGSKGGVEEFMERAKGENGLLDANSFIPYPKDWAELDKISAKWHDEMEKQKGDTRVKWLNEHPRPEDGYNHGGYDWCVANWGTKWNLSEPNIREDDNKGDRRIVKFNFGTAWSPPIPVIEQMAEIFPDLKFELRFYEGGMAFQGKFIWKNGQLHSQNEGTYKGNRGG